MVEQGYPKTLAEYECTALYNQSARHAKESIRKMNQFHEREEAREACYRAILAHMSQWVAASDLEQYLQLPENFQTPQFFDAWDHKPIKR
jgi:hypothetical protein